jgi:protein-S-isoprenylcysteine O-methyltransferase Ste14
MSTRQRAMCVVPAIIVAIAAAFGTIGYLLDIALGLPQRFQTPWAVRGSGVVVLALGMGVMGWIWRYRRPGDILVSTYVTMQKAFRNGSFGTRGEGVPKPESRNEAGKGSCGGGEGRSETGVSERATTPGQPSARTEPLVLAGPQRHVRHPMYFAVVVIWLGWWLVLDYTLIMWMTLLFFLWFNLVVIRFEERELLALYPEQYTAYIRAVPKFFPSIKPRCS